MARMKRLEKLDGFANVQIVEVEQPEPGPDQMLIEVKRSLISRGSELFWRYVREEAVSPEMMGYSDAGEVVGVGANIQDFAVGQRVMANTPHAQTLSLAKPREPGALSPFRKNSAMRPRPFSHSRPVL